MAIACSRLLTCRPAFAALQCAALFLVHRALDALASRLPYLRRLELFFAAICHTPRTGDDCSHRGARPGARLERRRAQRPFQKRRQPDGDAVRPLDRRRMRR